jgi:hypothetical protein
MLPLELPSDAELQLLPLAVREQQWRAVDTPPDLYPRDDPTLVEAKDLGPAIRDPARHDHDISAAACLAEVARPEARRGTDPAPRLLQLSLKDRGLL